MNRRITGEGTSELEWMACVDLLRLPFESADSLVPAGSRLVICAPHPDDEILPCGGLVAAAFDRGREISIVAVTDGEASHGQSAREFLRWCRPAETMAALECLGVRADVIRLRIPDGQVSSSEDLLVEALRRELRTRDIVLVPWRLDGHPDHEAAAEGARRAASEAGARILECPIWGWHWSNPATTPLPWGSGIRLEMSADIRRRKRAAIAAFRSQLGSIAGMPPILTDSTLKRFARDWEVYFR